MSALPYMPLYVADYLADTSHLTALENGAYLMLIMNYWQRGNALPSKPEQLARIARVSIEEWQTIYESLEGFFEVVDGKWVHLRIETELAKVHEKSVKASNAGKASAQRKTTVKPSDGEQTFNERSTDVEQTFNHTDTDIDTKKKELTHREREGFEEFWTSYPEAGRVSWDATEKAWLALPEKDRGRALEALPSFKTWISKQKNDYITLHAAKFLSTKRFKDHEAPTGKGGTAKSIPILKGTPEFDAWLVAKGGKLPAFPIRGEGGRLVGEGCYQPTKFPPSNEAVAA